MLLLLLLFFLYFFQFLNFSFVLVIFLLASVANYYFSNSACSIMHNSKFILFWSILKLIWDTQIELHGNTRSKKKATYQKR